MKTHEPHITAVLDQLAQQELTQTAEQQSLRLPVSPSTGRFLELLIEEHRPTRILEIGPGCGYSTIWIARAAQCCGATVDSVGSSQDSQRIAVQNLKQCHLQDLVTVHLSASSDFLSQAPSSHWDLIFLNADRSDYVSWWPALLRVSRRLLVVCTGAVAHAPDFQQLLSTIDRDPTLERTILTVGHGLLLIRHRSPDSNATDLVDGLPLLTPKLPD